MIRMNCNLKLLAEADFVVWGLYRPLASEFTDDILRPANHLNANQSPASSTEEADVQRHCKFPLLVAFFLFKPLQT